MSEKRESKILAKTCDLIFVEIRSFDEVLLCFVEYLNLHCIVLVFGNLHFYARK